MTPRADNAGPNAAAPLREALRRLDAVAPSVPLAAFGQTPLWDEPLKALVAASGRPMIVGIHDLDYFSRLRAPLPGPAWQIVPRNDGTHRETWIAAGELSALLGGEVWPTRQALADAGIRLDRLLPEGEAGQAALDRLTEAWGWRGIAQNTAAPSVVCDVRARDVAPALADLLDWGERESRGVLADAASRRNVSRFLRALKQRVASWADQAPPGARLTDLFGSLLRWMYEVLLGEFPSNVSIEHTRDFFRFNARAAGRGRFAFVGAFLDPATAALSRAAYDRAVAGSGMALLAENGPGATPFDVYAPGRGRGALSVEGNLLRVAFDRPIEMRTAREVTTVADLAAALESALGDQASLIGKAIALPPMVAGEFVMLLTETGSSYMPRTHRMIEAMREGGVALRLHPLLRLKPDTWRSVQAVNAVFRLPEHLAQLFGRNEVSAREFGRRWEARRRSQERTLRRLARVSSPCELADFLPPDRHAAWFRRMRQLMKANATILRVQERVDVLRREALSARAAEDEVRAEMKMLERERGEWNRAALRPLKQRLDALPADAPACDRRRMEREYQRADRRGRALLLSLEQKQAERKRLQARRKEIGRRIRAIERGAQAAAARRTIHSVQNAVARERLRLVRNGLLACEGLEHANHRPAAWWFPALDPSGRWFRRLRRAARYRLEPFA